MYRDRIRISIDDFHGDPNSLVSESIRYKSLMKREESRGRDIAPNEIWCIFDEDEHPDVKGAIQSADGNGIFVGYSNPCIELWFLIHFRDQSAFIDRHDAQRLAYEELGGGKRLSDDAIKLLLGSFEDAKSRAISLERMHVGNFNNPHSNPSSNLWKLVDRCSNPGSVS
jgi:hypothetical protein